MYGKEFQYSDRGYVKTAAEVYTHIMKKNASRVIGKENQNYYYFDHPETCTRYIVIDTNELITPTWTENGVWNCDVSITRTQVEWFADLLKQTPHDWGIIVCGHIPIVKELKWSFPKVCIFGELIEAYNRRTRFDGTDDFAVRADFTEATGRVLLYTCGHGHIDDLYVSPTDCVYVETHCESVKNNNGGSPYPRESGTITETVIDVFILDRNTNKLHVVRYGAGEDREA